MTEYEFDLSKMAGTRWDIRCSRRRNLNDYLYEVTKKWSPLTEGMGRKSAEIVSFCMEREARHLQIIRDNGGFGETTPVWLKYIFPVLRRTLPRLSVLDRLAFEESWPRFVAHIHDIIKVELTFILRNEDHGCRRDEDMPDQSSPEIKRCFLELAERTAESYKLFHELEHDL